MQLQLHAWRSHWGFVLFLMSTAMLGACGQSEKSSSETRMVNGYEPDAGHPAHYSAGALVKGGGQQTFCSGTIVAEKLIVTAAHCIFRERVEDMQVLFGRNLQDPASILIDVVEKNTFKKTQKYDSNFDIAWLRLKEPIPAGYQPIEIWHNPDILVPEAPLTIAGYGRTASNCSFVDASCQGGNLLSVETAVQRFVSDKRIYSLIVIGPQEGRGPCFGDSGGPAYLRHEGRWYLAGNFMGWDKVLVPEDRNTICDTGEAIYNFVGDYAHWIEESSGLELAYQPASNPRPSPTEIPAFSDPDPETFAEWCAYGNHEDPAWYTVQRIIRLAAESHLDKQSGFDASQAFLDCDYAADLVFRYIKEYGSLRLVGFDPKDNIDFAHLEDLRPLKSLAGSGLKQLILADHNIFDLSPIAALDELEVLEVVDNHLRYGSEQPRASLDLISLPNLRKLRLNSPNVPIDFTSIGELEQLETLDLSHLEMTSLDDLANLPLKELRLEAVEVLKPGPLPSLPRLVSLIIRGTDVKAIDGAMPHLTVMNLWGLASLEAIDISSSHKLESVILYDLGIRSLPNFDDFAQLKELAIVGNSRLKTIGTIGPLASLERIELIDNALSELGTWQGLPLLREAILSQNNLTDLAVEGLLPMLQNLEISRNQLRSLDFLQQTPNLRFLDISGNPDVAIEHLRDLPHLERLAMQNSKGGGLTSLDALANLPQLREINVKSNSLESLAPLTAFKDLEVILASQNFIKSVDELGEMTSLDYLELADNPITSRYCPIEQHGGFCRFEWLNIKL